MTGCAVVIVSILKQAINRIVHSAHDPNVCKMYRRRVWKGQDECEGEGIKLKKFNRSVILMTQYQYTLH